VRRASPATGGLSHYDVARPEVLLLDELFSALDALTRADLQGHALDLARTFKPTLVLVTCLGGRRHAPRSGSGGSAIPEHANGGGRRGLIIGRDGFGNGNDR
jgi:hypothetical protein